MLIATVLLPLPFDKGFSYLVPEGMDMEVGQYVRVPFRNRELIGVVSKLEDQKEVSKKIKELKFAYDVPGMTEEMLRFISWTAKYNVAPVGSVLKMALSVPQAIEKEYKPKEVESFESGLVKLSEEQEKAAKALIQKLSKKHSVTVLDGVTGSGKTEVYLSVIEKVIESGGQALVLLPEIVLTTQLLQRFEERFGFKPLEWHSSLTPKKRREAWQAVQRGDAKFVVGARSALFLPFQNLKFIVIDEEHDQSFKQEEGVIYNARDMAIVRASIEKIPVILSSATPSVETVWNVKQKKYDLLHLTSRFGDAVLPEIRLVDLNLETTQKKEWISTALREEIKKTLAAGKQSMLFLNRRGYAPITICGSCNNKIECPNCNFWMVEHRGKEILQCHYCGHHSALLTECPHCGEAEKIYAVGPGVERIAEEVQSFLPDARVAVLTSDTVANQKQASETLQNIINHEVDIIIGTQMIAKGLHFSKLHLVGVIDADSATIGGDIRAVERTYQLLHQVSGRAGRESEKGLVLLQTNNPESQLLQNLASGNRDKFIANELEDREIANMPPYSRIAIVGSSCVSEERNLFYMRELARNAPSLEEVQVMGPSPSPLFMLRGRYRHRFVVRAEKNIDLQKLMNQWIDSVPRPANIRLKVDIDPYSFH